MEYFEYIFEVSKLNSLKQKFGFFLKATLLLNEARVVRSTSTTSRFVVVVVVVPVVVVVVVDI